ncbi:MAG: TRAP transporter small permease subunit [Alphaproteobacteria bacterium TMED89]|nr:hypothetical protein [Rhodospirillaceae bacterium]RPH15486.1 MAG: TRAP transporter small permease subunit [Alphaproteobacteria bacterium TMED89]
MVLPTNHDVLAGSASGQLTILSGRRSALGAALLLLSFAGLFILGGWGALGDPPKPFARAEGFFVSGIWLQSLVLLAVLAVVTAGPRILARWADSGLALLWWCAAGAAMLAIVIIFIWASARFLFGMSALPPAWMLASRPETWWIEVALACMGLSLTCAIPVLLRTGEHVAIDVLRPILAKPSAQRWIRTLGSAGLAVPVGWLLLTKGSVFAARAWSQWEGSQNFGIEFVFLVKTLVPLMGYLIALTASLNLRDHVAGVAR